MERDGRNQLDARRYLPGLDGLRALAVLAVIAYHLPVDYGKGRILFAGETAGFLNPMGEGISAGLESGYAAAKAIQQVDLQRQFDMQTIYVAYKEYSSELKTYMERQWRFVASISSKFSAHKI